ncbi:MAG: FAD-dependent monooxygenase [Rhodobacteraceae bacterium]|nr:FAD-dependent monooxygenase [Paracoccaceae bacterium]
MEMNGAEFSIIGAGIGGLAAAIALSRKGAKITLYDQAKALGEVGAGLQISPNGVAVLDALGLKDKAAALANTPDAIVLRDYKGAKVTRLNLNDKADESPYWQFHRADLLAVLAGAARKAGVRFCFDHKVTNVARNGAGALIEFSEQESVLVDCLIAADGVRSVTRAAIFAGEAAEFTGQVAWRGLVPTDRLPDGLFANETQVFMGKGRHLVTYPLRGGSVINFVAVEERQNWASEGWNIPDSPENLRNAFSGWAAPVEHLLAAVDHTFLWGLFNHPPLARWSDGQVALLGDSCHPMLPYLAQGAVMGLEDAWVLADALEKSDDIPAGLRDYENRRKSRATRVQNAAKRNAWGYHLRTPGFRGMAHTILRNSSSDRLLARYDWLYKHDVTKT